MSGIPRLQCAIAWQFYLFLLVFRQFCVSVPSESSRASCLHKFQSFTFCVIYHDVWFVTTVITQACPQLTRDALKSIEIRLVCAVFQGCRTTERQGFGCQPGHVIEIHSAEAGIIQLDDSKFGRGPCLLTDTNCSWLINQSHSIKKCNEQQRCSLTSEVYNRMRSVTRCPPRQSGNIIKITYSCVPQDHEGLLS